MGENADMLLGGRDVGICVGEYINNCKRLNWWWLGKWLRRKEVTLKIYAMGRGLSFKHGV